MGWLYTHVYLKVQLCLKIQLSTCFGITRYAEVVIYTQNLLFCHSIIWSFSEWYRGGKRVTEKVWHMWVGWKMPLCASDIFLNDPMVIFLLYWHIILYYVRVTSMRNLVTVLLLKSKLSGKFQRFNAVDGSMENWYIAGFPKISIKMKKSKTSYKAQAVSCLKDTIQFSPDESFQSLWQ